MNKKVSFIKLIIICAIAAAFISVVCHAQVITEDDYSLLRKEMVAGQIEARGISDKSVIAALNKVLRHKFVPEKYRHLAYEDHPLPIGEGQTISQPYIVALMTEVIGPNKKMKVLEIGTGSGYQAAVLAELCGSVYTIEIVEALGLRAKLILEELYKNVKVKIGDGYKGWPEEAPFDAMIVTCAPTHIPKPLAGQLKEGGKMVIPVGSAGSQELVVMTKKDGKLIQKAIIPVRFVPMVDSKGKTY
ncbi:MAG: protein-L-isoaspartate(D-aspartate) O-methyltransferase [Syntrophaceae bacterium]|nr:protein-L-isoaspartate(D-aspartate) O-methyltransferase [Syntrophaceae bacterium]